MSYSMGCIYQNLVECGMSCFINSVRNGDDLVFWCRHCLKVECIGDVIGLEVKVANQSNQWTLLIVIG
jgi:hypothetical protein